MNTFVYNKQTFVTDLQWITKEFKSNQQLKNALADCNNITVPFGIAIDKGSKLFNLGVTNGATGDKAKYYSLAGEVQINLKKNMSVSGEVVVIIEHDKYFYFLAYTRSGFICVDRSFSPTKKVELLQQLSETVKKFTLLNEDIKVITAITDNGVKNDIEQLLERSKLPISENISNEKLLTISKKSIKLRHIRTLSSFKSGDSKGENLILVAGVIVCGLWLGEDYLFPEKEEDTLPPPVVQEYEVDAEIVNNESNVQVDNAKEMEALRKQEREYLDAELEFEKNYLGNINYSNPFYSYLMLIKYIKELPVIKDELIIAGSVNFKQIPRQSEPEKINFVVKYDRMVTDENEIDEQLYLYSDKNESAIYNQAGTGVLVNELVELRSAYTFKNTLGLKELRERSLFRERDLRTDLKKLRKEEIIEDFAISYVKQQRQTPIRSLKTLNVELYDGWLIAQETVNVDIKLKFITNAEKLAYLFKKYPNFNVSEVNYDTRNSELIVRGEFNVIQ
ncbi:hypothetical protein [Photobacterium leiognathi]|uniref:hypothetical protein n=1 Tax=Photobacterium leiognathi TaxID=553611 RepID=UPI002981C6A9|nr:hypothetical protein [Photobacterium leiognathi]